jgi:hypothetical protein
MPVPVNARACLFRGVPAESAAEQRRRTQPVGPASGFLERSRPSGMASPNKRQSGPRVDIVNMFQR